MLIGVGQTPQPGQQLTELCTRLWAGGVLLDSGVAMGGLRVLELGQLILWVCPLFGLPRSLENSETNRETLKNPALLYKNAAIINISQKKGSLCCFLREQQQKGK